jgi:hypothetical protein
MPQLLGLLLFILTTVGDRELFLAISLEVAEAMDSVGVDTTEVTDSDAILLGIILILL